MPTDQLTATFAALADPTRRACRLSPQPLQDATDHLERYTRLWEASFDRLAEHLRTTTAPAPKAKEHR